MKCIVGNSQFAPDQLIYRDRGYGTALEQPLVEYTLFVANEELDHAFSRSFSEFIEICKEDDAASDISDIPELKLLDYPSLSEMLAKHRALLAEIIRDYLYFQVLDALLGGNERSAWRFALNEIAEAVDEEIGYALRGRGYFI